MLAVFGAPGLLLARLVLAPAADGAAALAAPFPAAAGVAFALLVLPLLASLPAKLPLAAEMSCVCRPRTLMGKAKSPVLMSMREPFGG